VAEKRRRLARLLTLAAAAVLLLGTAGVLFVSYQTANNLIHPERILPPPTPGTLNLSYENVTFNSTDGTRLTGWWIPADSTPADNRTVLFLHGFTSSKNQSLHVAPWLHGAGYNLLAFDFRAHGESEGEFTTVGDRERWDASAAAGYLQTRPDLVGCAPSCPFALMGWSMGGAVALLVAPDLPHLQAVVVDSPFSTLREASANAFTYFTGLPRWPFGPIAVWFAEQETRADLDQVTPVESIGRLRAPLLMIHGTADPVAPPSEHDRLKAAAEANGVPLTAWMVRDAAHVRGHGIVPEEYEQRVVAFLLREMPP